MKSYMTDRSPEVMEIMRVLGISNDAVVGFSLHVRYNSFVVLEVTKEVPETGGKVLSTRAYRLELIEGPNHEDPREHETSL